MGEFTTHELRTCGPSAFPIGKHRPKPRPAQGNVRGDWLVASDAFRSSRRNPSAPFIPPGLGILGKGVCRCSGLRLRLLGGDLLDGGVVGVELSPVRRQHFQCVEAMSLLAVDQL